MSSRSSLQKIVNRIKNLREKKSVFQKELDIASDVGIKYNLKEQIKSMDSILALLKTRLQYIDTNS